MSFSGQMTSAIPPPPPPPLLKPSPSQLQSDLSMATTGRHSLSFCSPLVATSEVMPVTSTSIVPLRPNASDLEQGTEPASSSAATSTTNTSSGRCVSRELFTCLALSSIVIGLPIAIIIVLFNLPRFSTRRDTRQQHYILLAFGFPFSLVVSVSVMYGIYRLVMRIRSGPDHSKYLRSRLSWRRFSRRLRGAREVQPPHLYHRRHINGHSHSRVSRHSEHGRDISEGGYLSDDCSSESVEPKLYTLVTEMMSQQQNQHSQQRPSQPAQQHRPSQQALPPSHLRPSMHQVFPEMPGSGQRRSIAHVDTTHSQSIEPTSRRFSHQHRLSPTVPFG